METQLYLGSVVANDLSGDFYGPTMELVDMLK